MASLIIVEDATTAQAMQRGVSEDAVKFAPYFHDVSDRKYDYIYVRWPSLSYVDAKHMDVQNFQDWVRMRLMLSMKRGGDFQYI